MLKERAKTAIFVVLWLGLVVLIVGTSPSFQSCTNEHSHYEGGNTLYERAADLLIFFKTWFGCSGEFVHKNAEAIIAVFTVILGIATWLLWRATKNLVLGADQNAERQLRAYISFTPTVLTGAYPQLTPAARYVMKNTGQTPAYNIRQSGILEVLPHPLPDNQGDLVTIDPTIPTPIAGRPIHSGEHLEGEAIADAALTFEDFQRMNSPDHRLYLAGIIWYEDIFGITRNTKFCVYMGGPEYEGIALRAHTNRAIPQSADWLFSHVHNEAT